MMYIVALLVAAALVWVLCTGFDPNKIQERD